MTPEILLIDKRTKDGARPISSRMIAQLLLDPDVPGADLMNVLHKVSEDLMTAAEVPTEHKARHTWNNMSPREKRHHVLQSLLGLNLGDLGRSRLAAVRNLCRAITFVIETVETERGYIKETDNADVLRTQNSALLDTRAADQRAFREMREIITARLSRIKKDTPDAD